MTCGFWCGSFASAGPGPPVMNGIFKICHWIWASFLANPAGGLYIFFPVPLLPSCCWIGVLKVFLFHSYPFQVFQIRLDLIFSSFFLKTFVWKIFLFLLTFRRTIVLCKRIFQKKKISNQLLQKKFNLSNFSCSTLFSKNFRKSALRCRSVHDRSLVWVPLESGFSWSS